ncbi:hypothetical protein Pst134EA_029200 [Puccinia striiformis f. sp. tritici]|uniref:hypothetical protein n=1 Tax=Puccinia striiformis f. sp. tritici TaxID=168172 RepID=UPI002008E236|nr:hypothetical protein Pst134EA_029200 [Puccinia striiformis f. sp. tritici]KAH9447156.1 hypothetical protein Pst134EA_029200 [Puccinia striiformis f. sp. tritici]
MFAQFLLVISVWLIPAPCDGAINRVIGVEHGDQPLRALTFPRKKMAMPRNQSSLSYRPSRSNDVETNDGSDQESVFERLAKDLLPVKDLTPEQRSEMIRNWRADQENVVSLYKDSKELLEIHNEIRNQFEWIQKNNKANRFKDFPSVIDLVEKSQETILIFKQLKMFEMGKIDLHNSNLGMINLLLRPTSKSQPYNDFEQKMDNLLQDEQHTETLRMISKGAWQNFALAFVGEVKKLVVDYGQEFKNLEVDSDDDDDHESFEAIINWKYVFKIIDFLYKHGFINQDNVQEILREHDMVDQVIYFASARFHHEIQEDAWVSFTRLTDHWYWLLLSDSFKALDEEGKKTINLCFIQKRLSFFAHQFHKKIPGNIDDGHNFHTSFLIEDYTSDQIMKEYQEINRQQAYPKRCQEYIKNLINILINTKSISPDQDPIKKMLNFYVYKYISFIEVELFPGILKETIEKELHMKSEGLAESFKFICLATEVEELGHMAKTCFKYSNIEDLSVISYHQKYHNRVSQLFPELEKTYSQVCQKYDGSLRWLSDTIHVHCLFQKSVGSFDQLDWQAKKLSELRKLEED